MVAHLLEIIEFLELAVFVVAVSHTFNLSFLLLTVTHFLEIIEFLEFLEYAIPGISSCMFLYNSEKCLCRGLVSLLIRGILNLSSLHTPKLFLTSLSSV